MIRRSCRGSTGQRRVQHRPQRPRTDGHGLRRRRWAGMWGVDGRGAVLTELMAEQRQLRLLPRCGKLYKAAVRVGTITSAGLAAQIVTAFGTGISSNVRSFDLTTASQVDGIFRYNLCWFQGVCVCSVGFGKSGFNWCIGGRGPASAAISHSRRTGAPTIIGKRSVLLIWFGAVSMSPFHGQA